MRWRGKGNRQLLHYSGHSMSRRRRRLEEGGMRGREGEGTGRPFSKVVSHGECLSSNGSLYGVILGFPSSP